MRLKTVTPQTIEHLRTLNRSFTISEWAFSAREAGAALWDSDDCARPAANLLTKLVAVGCLARTVWVDGRYRYVFTIFGRTCSTSYSVAGRITRREPGRA